MQLNHTLVSLLKDISERVGQEDQKKISSALEDVRSNIYEKRPDLRLTTAFK